MSDDYAAINERRDTLESLAEKDLPCSGLAETLLEIAGDSE